MTESKIIVRVPATLAVAGVPADLTDHSQKATFALAKLAEVFKAANLDVRLEGDQALFGYAEGSDMVFVTTSGHDIGKRHYRLAPDGDKHSLEVSVDDGKTFDPVATIDDQALARAIGDAWADGRISAQ